MQELTLKARAKINLGLDVLRRREDGYHELRMIMQTVDLCDQLTMRITKKPGITIRTNVSFLPVNEDNLIYRACRMLMEEFQIPGGVEIELDKHIPVAAGLAGGSSDAAAALVGCNQLFRLGLTQEELMKRGVRIGADVPYCIMRGTALAEGIGEKLTAMPAPKAMYVLLVKPDIQVSTKFVYQNLHLDENMIHPDIDRQVRGLQSGDIDELISGMGNVLETVTIPAHPIIADIKQQLMDMSASCAMMSGSGPTVFALFEKKDAAQAAFEEMKKLDNCSVHLTDFWN